MAEADEKLYSILMTDNLAQKTFDGLKTQTRRVIRYQPPENCVAVLNYGSGNKWQYVYGKKPNRVIEWANIKCRYGKVGDVVYIRENYFAYGQWRKDGQTATGGQKWRFVDFTDGLDFSYQYTNSPPPRVQSGKSENIGWYKRPAIYMPAAAARSRCRIEAIRSERVQSISETDAKAEGVEPIIWNGDDGKIIDYRTAYADLWDVINEDRDFSWDVNPWVWAITYKKYESSN